MKNLNENREILKLDDLIGFYDEKLLKDLREGKYDELALLSSDDRNNGKIMEPLLYAVKNEKNTYKVYKYYGETLQRDILRDNKELAVNIVIKEPELIEGTPISRDPQFILENVQINPKVIRYMDSRLKTDSKFIDYLSNQSNSEIISEIARAGVVAEILNNPELSNDKEFMSNAIRNDVTFLEYISEDLKNDGEFLRTEASQNEDVINYVANNAEKFGLEGIEGVRESSTEYITSNKEYLEIIDNKAQEENRYKNAKEKIQKHTNSGNKGTATFVTAAVVSQSDNVNEEFVRRTLNYATLTMEAIKRDITKSGEMKLDLENRQQRRLVTPKVFDRLLKKLEEQGISLDEEFKQKMDNYKEFYNGYMSKVRETNKQKANDKKTLSIEEVRESTKEAVLDTAREITKKEQEELQH